MSYLKIRIDDNFSRPLAAKLRQAGPRAAHAVAKTIMADTMPFVPASGAPAGMYKRTQVVDNQIIYPGPYARYLYFGKVMVFKDPPYLKPRKKDGKVVLTHYGQKKYPIDKPLEIKKHHHGQATDHWLDASKAQNLGKWIKAAGEAVEDELKRK